MIILFIPFSEHEAWLDLSLKADLWRDHYLEHDEESKQKNVVIIQYSAQEDADAIDRLPDTVQEALRLGKAQIYVLGHGNGSEELCISNVAADRHYEKTISLPISEVAKRFSHTFLESDCFNDATKIKLYFCDVKCTGKPRLMAEAFQSYIESAVPRANLFYYSDAVLSYPCKRNESSPNYLKPQRTGTSSKRAQKCVSYNQEHEISFCISIQGSPSMFRHTLAKRYNLVHANTEPSLRDYDLEDHFVPENGFYYSMVYGDLIIKMLQQITSHWDFNQTMLPERHGILRRLTIAFARALEQSACKIRGMNMPQEQRTKRPGQHRSPAYHIKMELDGCMIGLSLGRQTLTQLIIALKKLDVSAQLIPSK